jgi:chromosome condensin MukBEF complex kleisin-like MukF subunit
MTDFRYHPEPPKVRLTQEGRARLARARHEELVLRIHSQTGELPAEIEAKLAKSWTHCKKHGWRRVHRCELCRSEYKQARKPNNARELVQKLRTDKPELAELLKTGREVEDARQTCFRFPQGRANR